MALIEESVELQEINPSQVHVISVYSNQACKQTINVCYCFQFFLKPKTQTLMNNVTLFILMRWLHNYKLFEAAD